MTHLSADTRSARPGHGSPARRHRAVAPEADRVRLYGRARRPPVGPICCWLRCSRRRPARPASSTRCAAPFHRVRGLRTAGCCDHRHHVGRDDARHDAPDGGADDPDLCRDRRDRVAQGRADRVAARADRRISAGLVRLRAVRDAGAGWRSMSLADWPGAAAVAMPASAVLFLAAGLYQFSALKQACLTRMPAAVLVLLPELDRPVRAACSGSGVRQGLYCLGCCIAMMLLMFAAGAMNVVWMALLGLVMTDRKDDSVSAHFGRAIGCRIHRRWAGDPRGLGDRAL